MEIRRQLLDFHETTCPMVAVEMTSGVEFHETTCRMVAVEMTSGVECHETTCRIVAVAMASCAADPTSCHRTACISTQRTFFAAPLLQQWAHRYGAAICSGHFCEHLGRGRCITKEEE